MSRITLNEQYIRITEVISLRGTCKRAKVGCVIVKDGRIISTGYNGPIGESHCQMFCDISKKCEDAIHAEANAIFFAAKEGIPLEGCTLYCNFSPCSKCAQAIIQAGIKNVIYQEAYRDISPIANLRLNGVHVMKMNYEK